MAEKNYYQILEVGRDVDPETLKTVFRNLAKKYHPDANEDDSSHDFFLQINEAYQVLSDEQLKAEYDFLLDNPGTGRVFIPPPPPKEYRKKTARQRRNERQKGSRAAAASHMYKGSRYTHRVARPLYRKKIEEGSAAQIGFYYFSLAMRICALASLGIALMLTIDFYSAKNIENQQVKSYTVKPYTLFEPGILRINTANHYFDLNRGYRKYIQPGTRLDLKVTPWGKHVTHAYLTMRIRGKDYVRKVKVFGGLYGSNFFLIFLVLLTSVGTLLSHRMVNAELASYAGTANFLLGLMLVWVNYRA